MRLISLRLSNFRQFKGDTPELLFASPGDRPITVFFGTNGAGKTALLNAFTWTLYGSTSRGFLMADQIVNKAALRDAKVGDTVDAFVEMKFDHLDWKYLLRKTQRVRRGDTEAEITLLGDPVTELQCAGPDGRWRSEKSIEDTIGRILPEDLHTYFFFDGERIERLVQPSEDERADIANATKKLFSLEILDRAIRHVGAAKRTLEAEYQRIGDARTVQLIDEKRTVEATISEKQHRVRELDRNIDGYRQTEEEIQNRLRNLQAVRQIQERREGLQADQAARKTSLNQARAEVSALISSRAYTIFLADACETYTKIVELMRQRGELPAGIKKQFVEDLLEKSLCICGRSLDHANDEKARSVVAGWKDRAGLADVEEKAIRMGGEVKQLDVQTEQFWSQLDQFEERRSSDRQELFRIQENLERISEQLRHSGEEEVGPLEERRRQILKSIEEGLIEQGSCRERLKSLQDRQSEIEADLRKHEATEAKQQLAKRRLDAARDVIERIEESKRRFEAKFRFDLTKKLRALFEKISYKPYVPEITEEYALCLRESAGGIPLPVAAGQGESQILSLCFIGAVIELAREYQARQERLPGPDSSQYPVVMDSPFGSLGPTYRRQVADHVTKLADQVIIMATNTQWRGEVEQSLSGRVGKAYVLQYHSPKPDLSIETIEIGAASHELIKGSPNEFEYTTVLEV